MLKLKPNIVFFGSGPVGRAALAALAEVFTIEAVFTKGKVPPAGYPQLFSPADQQELAAIIQELDFRSRIGVVVDYGLIIPPAVIDSFELGIINSHFSWLPELRGADPITAAILSGQSETGVSLMRIEPKLDTGRLLAQAPYQIGKTDTVIDLTDGLIELSNQMLRAVLPEYLEGKLVLYDQDPEITPTYTKKLQKADGILDFQKPATQLEREVRAYLGWPGSQTELAGKRLIITKARVIKSASTPGQFFTHDGLLAVGTTKDALLLQRLKLAGKSEMSSADYLRGHPLPRR